MTATGSIGNFAGPLDFVWQKNQGVTLFQEPLVAKTAASTPIVAKPLTPLQSLFIEAAGTTDLSMQWFVLSADTKKAKYIPRANCGVVPFSNSAAAFAALQKAIEGARHTIDYITWGFDPTMRMTPGGKCIAEILLNCVAARPELRIRLLFWYPGPMWSAVYGQSDSGLLNDGKTAFDTPNLVGYSTLAGQKDKFPSAASWFNKLSQHSRIKLVTRAMNSGDVGNAVANNKKLTPEKTGWLDAKIDQETVLKKAATHHQKMVLIDYVNSKIARGFVLGSNTLQRYWDSAEHAIDNANRSVDYMEEYISSINPFSGAPVYSYRKQTAYLQPWQDVSAEVKGGVLFDLNANFVSAWKRAGGGALEAARESLKPENFAQPNCSFPAQIIRTQPQESDITISNTYFQNVLNARKYIYFENQYFRLPELTSHIETAASALGKGGRKESLYLFVVTNVPDEHGWLTTYQMLSALGKADQMKPMTSDGRVDAKGQEKLAKHAPEPLPATKSASADTPAKLQTVVCTLASYAPKKSGGFRYAPVYVHSKVMLIDDNYLTLGSANLNRRSFASDSELNISYPNPATTRKLREDLWSAHRREGLESDFEAEFKKWERIAKDNLDALEKKNGELTGHLVKLKNTGPAVFTVYD